MIWRPMINLPSESIQYIILDTGDVVQRPTSFVSWKHIFDIIMMNFPLTTEWTTPIELVTQSKEG